MFQSVDSPKKDPQLATFTACEPIKPQTPLIASEPPKLVQDEKPQDKVVSSEVSDEEFISSTIRIPITPLGKRTH
jgi:hypothetical protein